MALRAVFLDVGNTLLVTHISRFELYARVARGRGLAVDAHAMHRCMRLAHSRLPESVEGTYRYGDAWFRAFIEDIFVGQLGLEASLLRDTQEELFALFEDPANYRVYPHFEELVAGIRGAGLALGIISNWSARLPRLMAGLGWQNLFDPVLVSALEGMEKPDGGIFLRACGRVAVQPHEALHAGDHPRLDVLGARDAGLRGVLVDHGKVFAGNERPGPCVSSLRELLLYILAHSES